MYMLHIYIYIHVIYICIHVYVYDDIHQKSPSSLRGFFSPHPTVLQVTFRDAAEVLLGEVVPPFAAVDLDP